MRVHYSQVSPEEQAIRERENRPAPNLQLAIANAPAVAEAQLELLRAITGSLELRTRELVILELGRLLDNAYCWGHHVPVAVECGVSEEQLRAMRGGDHSPFDDDDRQLLAFADAVEARTVTDEKWAGMAKRFSDEELVLLTMLVGYYGMVSRVGDALQVPQDLGFGGFEVP